MISDDEKTFDVLTSYAMGMEIKRHIGIPVGSSIDDIIEKTLPGFPVSMRSTINVKVNGYLIFPGLWNNVRPKAGKTVIIQIVPKDNSILKNVLTIAATVAAVALGQWYLGPWLGTALLGEAAAAGTAGKLITAGVTLALSLGVSLLMSAFIKPRKSDYQSPTYTINGWKNTANPDGPVPMILGEHRFAPPYFQPPWTEAIGDDVWVTAGFVIGYGPLAIRNPRIGDTPTDKYLASDIKIEIMEGYEGDPKSKICRYQVIQEDFNIKLGVGKATTRWTARDITKFGVDITAPQGMYGMNNEKGKAFVFSVAISLQIRNVGTNEVTVLPPIVLADSRPNKPRVWTVWYNVPERGDYEITLNRQTPDEPDDQSGSKFTISSKTYLTSIKSVRPEYPLNVDFPLAIAAIRVKATEQANGTLDSFNIVARSLCDAWNAGTQTWEPLQETGNPGDLYRAVALGRGINYPITPEELDDIEGWRQWCGSKGLRYDRIHDYDATLLDVLADIAAAGRASHRDSGSKWGVVIDRIQTSIKNHITARNSYDFAIERMYKRFPDGLRIPFYDRNFGWKKSERIVPFPGFVGTPQNVEQFELPGKTNPDEIWIETRRYMYESQYRPDVISLMQDAEHLNSERGNRVLVSHDVVSRTMVASRVKEVQGALVILEDQVTMEEGKDYACRFRMVPNNADSATLSVVRLVANNPGTTNAFNLTGTGTLPRAGDLAMFGIAGQETIDCIVDEVEGGENLSARLKLLLHAPEIETLTDAEEPPPWNGRVGGTLTPTGDVPKAPRIIAVLSGFAAEQIATDDIPYPVAVQSAPALDEDLRIDHYLVQYRPDGSLTWSDDVVSENDMAIFPGTAKGDIIETRSRAVSEEGIVGPFSDIVETTLGADDPVDVTLASFSASYNGSMWRFAWGYAGEEEDEIALAGVQIRYSTGETNWEDMAKLHNGVLTASPWFTDSNADGEILPDGTYVFAARVIGGEGPLEPILYAVASKPANTFAPLLDDAGAILTDDAGAILLDDGE